MHSEDTLHQLGLTLHQKIIADLRHICYGACANIWSEYHAIGESTTIKSLKRFSSAIVNVFGNKYLRPPTSANVERLSAKNATKGFSNVRKYWLYALGVEKLSNCIAGGMPKS